MDDGMISSQTHQKLTRPSPYALAKLETNGSSQNVSTSLHGRADRETVCVCVCACVCVYVCVSVCVCVAARIQSVAG